MIQHVWAIHVSPGEIKQFNVRHWFINALIHFPQEVNVEKKLYVFIFYQKCYLNNKSDKSKSNLEPDLLKTKHPL